MRAKLTLAIGAILSFTQFAHAANEPSGFYSGRRIEVVVHESPGSSYDTYTRLLVTYLGKYIPGNPSFVVENMEGAGGIRAINYVGELAPKDGTVIATVGAGLLIDQALGLSDSIKVDLSKFGWLGSMSDSNSVLVTWHTSKTNDLDKAKSRETSLAVGDGGALGAQAPILINDAVGTKFKLIRGYTSAQQSLAMPREETEGRGAFPWSGYKSLNADWIRDKSINVLLQIGLKPEPDLPNVPLVCNLGATPEQKEMMQFLCNAVAIGRPYVVAPGVPADRLRILQNAFAAALHDPGLEADAKRIGLDIRLTDGDQLQAITTSALATPKPVLTRMRSLLAP